jgi:hypothetical protein
MALHRQAFHLEYPVMRTALKICRVQLILALAVGLVQLVQGQAGKSEVSFGIFQVVDCSTARAKTMLLKHRDKTETYCLSPKPIVNQTHLKEAKRTGHPERPMLSLRLTQEGGALMEETTRGVVGDGGKQSLGLVVDGKLISVARVMDVIRDEMVLQGGWTQEELDEIVSYLMGGAATPPSGQRKA